MNRYARTAPGQTLEIISTSPPFSFFNFVETRFSAYQPLRRILSQVRMHAGRTMVVERLDQPQDLREENEDLRKRNPDFASSTAFRLSFFTKEFSTKRGLVTLEDRDFIGYAILKEDVARSFGTVRRVYESIIKTRRL